MQRGITYHRPYLVHYPIIHQVNRSRRRPQPPPPHARAVVPVYRFELPTACDFLGGDVRLTGRPSSSPAVIPNMTYPIVGKRRGRYPIFDVYNTGPDHNTFAPCGPPSAPWATSHLVALTVPGICNTFGRDVRPHALRDSLAPWPKGCTPPPGSIRELVMTGIQFALSQRYTYKMV